MGIPVNTFVEEVDLDLICVICQEVLENTVKPLRCCHLFCHDCISGWLNASQTSSCPSCRSEITTLEIKMHVDNKIGCLLAKCENGCGHQSPYDELILHLPNCKPKQCSQDCGYQAFDFKNHNCVSYLRMKLAEASSFAKACSEDLRIERENTLQIRMAYDYEIDILNLRLEQSQEENQGLNTMNSLLRRELRESIRARLASTHSSTINPSTQ